MGQGDEGDKHTSAKGEEEILVLGRVRGAIDAVRCDDFELQLKEIIG